MLWPARDVGHADDAATRIIKYEIFCIFINSCLSAFFDLLKQVGPATLLLSQYSGSLDQVLVLSLPIVLKLNLIFGALNKFIILNRPLMSEIHAFLKYALLIQIACFEVLLSSPFLVGLWAQDCED